MEDENNPKFKISKEDIIKEYSEEKNSEPTWKDKKQKEMEKEEKNEYKKYRKRVETKKTKDKEEGENSEIIEKESLEKLEEGKILEVEEESKEESKEVEEEVEKNPEDKGFYEENKNNVTEEEKTELLISTGTDMRRDMLSDEQKGELEKVEEQNKFIEGYIKHNEIGSQEELNYSIEHDEKFRIFLEKTDRLSSLYTGKHLEEIESEKERILEQYREDAKKDKRNKIAKKFSKKKKQSNIFNESKKDLDLTPYKNKKLESQGSILTMYLRKNGLAQLRYVKMDEVGQIKVEGYVYHERDAVYRFGKKNDPLLIIMEGALVPINKETLKENLGCETAEAQKLIIKGIEQAEVVKSSGLDENAKKPFAPPKWMIIAGIAIAIGLYMFLGGSS